jgi:hypothetical protein
MTCLPVENRQRVAGIGIPVEQDIVRPRRPCDLEDALEDRIHHPIEIGMIELRVRDPDEEAGIEILDRGHPLRRFTK